MMNARVLLLLFISLWACKVGHAPRKKTTSTVPKATLKVDDEVFIPGADVINKLSSTIALADTFKVHNFTLYAKGEGQRAEMYIHRPDSSPYIIAPLHLLLNSQKIQRPEFIWDWHHHAQPPNSPLYLNDTTYVSSIDLWFTAIHQEDTLRSNTVKVKISK